MDTLLCAAQHPA